MKKLIHLFAIVILFNVPVKSMHEDSIEDSGEKVTTFLAPLIQEGDIKHHKRYKPRKEYENVFNYISSFSGSKETVDDRPHTLGSAAIKFLPIGVAMLFGGIWAYITVVSSNPYMACGVIVVVPGGMVAGGVAECAISNAFEL